MNSDHRERNGAGGATTLSGITAKIVGVSTPPGGVNLVPPFESEVAFDAWLMGFEQLARKTEGTDAAAIQQFCRNLRDLHGADVPEAARLGYLLGQYHFQVIRPLVRRHEESLPRSLAKHVIGHILSLSPEAGFPEIEQTIRNHRDGSLAGVHVGFVGRDRYLFNSHVCTRASLKTYVSQEKKKRR